MGRDNITLGYELYTFLALLVIFFAVALRLRTLDAAGRVFLVLMVAGGIAALYGISQDFGWDPISPGEDGARSLGTFGNPIFFGAFLLMAVFAPPSRWHCKRVHRDRRRCSFWRS